VVWQQQGCCRFDANAGLTDGKLYGTQNRDNVMKKPSTGIWLLAAAAVIAAMAGYNLLTTKKNVGSGKLPVFSGTRGIVAGITYSEERPLAVIDEKVVHEGDTIHGVRIVKIYRDKVEFEKNGQRWNQKVQERPGRAWP